MSAAASSFAAVSLRFITFLSSAVATY